MRHSPSAEQIEQIARAAIAAMPPLFRDHLGDVVLRVEDFADAETLASLGIENEWELSGVYEGRPLTEQSVWDTGGMPARIRLFRRPLLDEWIETGVSLDRLVSHVLIHEVGHHFGFSDEQMHALEEAAGD
ncbi:metallopeptidase family protein [Sphingobium sp. CR28]|uniref:metallopeptidase family protein n=1 Tax=Sphingobium sp. CR28 TaxID=3400272 RepID=UPI003FEDBB3D